LAGPARSWGHFARRPPATQIRTIILVVAVLGGTVAWIALSPPSSTTTPAAAYSVGSAVPVDQASTSTRGLTSTAINVGFPVVSLNSLAGQEGFASDVEFGQQVQAIHLFVNQINREGGINGRRINPVIASYDPASESSMRALCKTWTEGSPATFAVLDGIGAWTGDNQLCITQEGHTPFIGEWTTVTSWTDQGSPYLWWTGPDQSAILRAVVDWGVRVHLLGGSRKVGVIAGDRASDQAALDDVVLPALRKVGVNPVVVTIAADPSETATTDTEAPLVVQRFRSDGVDTILPIIPFNVFFPLLEAQSAQSYYPRLLLSDYESSIEVALGLMPVPFARALNGQEGLTTETLGGVDDDRPTAAGGYDPGLRTCWTAWHAAYPQIPPGTLSDFIEEQGPIADWCQAIHLFATAARAAGRDLNRRTFVTAMSKVTDFPGTVTPVLSYGPDKRYGPTEYQVVRLHINTPPSTQCKLPLNRIPQGTCWVTVIPFTPLPGT
jgi:ABC-type branched-subunit amino acid transport system substrate-binding protein